MKEKKNSKNTIGLVIIGILVILLICCVIYIYKLNNKILLMENVCIEQENDVNKEIKEIEILGIGKKFIKIEDGFKSILNVSENKYNSIQCDLDKDGIEEKISLECVGTKEIGYANIIINDKRVQRVEYYDTTLYVADLNENDSNLDIVLSCEEYGAGDVKYFYILDYKNNKLINLREALGEKYIAYSDIYMDQNGKVAFVSMDFPFNGSTFLANYYFDCTNNNELKIIEIDLSKALPRDMITKKDSGWYYTINEDILKVIENYHEKVYKNPEETLEDNGIYSVEEDKKIQVIDYYTNMIKAKLENGQIIYMFPTTGYLAG